MFNLFKMYCYKMFRQKSFYVIWFIMLFIEFISFLMTEGAFAEHSADVGAFYILIVAIFPTIFFCADISSGFIKNYAGTVSHKGMIMAARATTTFVQNLLTLAVVFTSLYAVTLFKGTGIGEISFILKYYVCMFLAGLACSFIGILITELTRNKVTSIILIIAIGSGLISQIASMLSLMITGSEFDIGGCTVTGRFPQLNLATPTGGFYEVAIIAICYIIISSLVCHFSIKKRDVV